MSINAWNRVRFWMYPLNHNSLSHQTLPIDRFKQGQWFSGINLEDWGYIPGPFQFSNQLQLLSNQLCQDSSAHFFEKVNKEQLKC